MSTATVALRFVLHQDDGTDRQVSRCDVLQDLHQLSRCRDTPAPVDLPPEGAFVPRMQRSARTHPVATAGARLVRQQRVSVEDRQLGRCQQKVPRPFSVSAAYRAARSARQRQDVSDSQGDVCSNVSITD